MMKHTVAICIFAIGTAIALVAPPSMAATVEHNPVHEAGQHVENNILQGHSLDAFLLSSMEDGGDLQGEDGHRTAAEAIFRALERRFERVLEVDISGWTDEQQFAFFQSVNELTSLMPYLYAKAQALGYTGIVDGLALMRTRYEAAAAVWTNMKSTNTLVQANPTYLLPTDPNAPPTSEFLNPASATIR